MNYKIETTENFRKQAKKLIKKYKSLPKEIEKLGDELSETPTLGTHIGENIYKIRLAINSKGKGKRGGARIMTYVKIINKKVYLFSIYSKGKKDNITNKEIQQQIKYIK